MIPLNESHRFWGALVVTGGVLFVVALIMHPPIFDPWDASGGLMKAATSRHWKKLHLVMAAGVSMWLVGLAGCSCMFHKNFHILRLAVSMFIGSMAKWLVISSTEIGAIPTILARLTVQEDYGLRSMGEVIFSSTIITSYSAMLLTWFATALVAAYLMEMQHKVFVPHIGFWSAWLGVIGIIAIFVFPRHAGLVAVTTSGPPFLWTMAYGWRFATKSRS